MLQYNKKMKVIQNHKAKNWFSLVAVVNAKYKVNRVNWGGKAVCMTRVSFICSNTHTHTHNWSSTNPYFKMC